MTKRHFEALAFALRKSRLGAPHEYERDERDLQWGADVRAVADVCASFNPSFRRPLFYAVVGYDAEQEAEREL